MKKIIILMVLVFNFLGLSFASDYDSYLKNYNWAIYWGKDKTSNQLYGVDGIRKFYKNFRFCDSGVLKDKNGVNIIGQWVAQNDYFTVKFWHLSDGFYAVQHRTSLGIKQQEFLSSCVICGWGNFIYPTFTNIKVIIVRGSHI